jgi:hypothetical protein
MPAVRPRRASFYVYYRIATDTRAAREQIGALIDDVAARTGIRGSLSARSDDPATWMEHYPSVPRPAEFRNVLATVAQAHGALALTQDGVRHVEEFAPLPPLSRRPRA